MTDAPPEIAIAEAQRIAERDAKFERVAKENRARAAARRAEGRPATALEAIKERVAKELEHAPRIDGRLARLEPDAVPIADVAAKVLRVSMIPERFRDATFEQFEPATDLQARALGAARAWVERVVAGESAMLAIIGPQGTGKSHLLYAAGNAVLDANRRIYGRPWYRLADELRYGGKHPVGNREIDAAEVRSALWSYPVVLLDEVRATASTAFDDTELTKFACHAYDARLAVFVTSNVWPLENVMGPPAASRFVQVQIDGPDRRQQPKPAPLTGRDLATGDHRGASDV